MENGSTQRREALPRDYFQGRSFVVATTSSREEQRALELEIEARGGTVHHFLNALTDVLVVAPVSGDDSGAHWVREQVRRGETYRARWGTPELVRIEELRAALRDGPESTG